MNIYPAVKPAHIRVYEQERTGALQGRKTVQKTRSVCCVMTAFGQTIQLKPVGHS